MERVLNITVNGQKYSQLVDCEKSLLEFLREDLKLTGTKKGCGKGECGACTVILNGKAVTSCIVPVMRADGGEVLTIEGLAVDGKLTPLQEQFIIKGAIQCGFCTPGMILSAKALLDEEPNPTREQIKEALGGNICRCTGYQPIEEAVLSAAEIMRKGEK